MKDKPLNDDEFRCVFVNTKNIPVHHSIVALDSDESNISKVLQARLKTPLKEGLSAGGGDLFIVRSELMNEQKREKVLQFFEDVQLNVVDEMILNDLGDSLYTSKGGYREPIKDAISSNEKTLNYEQFNRYDGYNEFSGFYAEEEILGLNPIENRFEVMENLKFGYQHEVQEYLGVIVYDDLNSVVSVDELFIGGINSAVVDHRIILKHVLAYEEAKGIIIFHNHPSGVPDPSPEDNHTTGRLQDVCEGVGLEFFDHYIVGKESVYSYEMDSSTFKSSNKEYSQAVKSEKRKYKNIEFEL